LERQFIPINEMLNLSILIFLQVFNNKALYKRARVQQQISEVAEYRAKNTLRQDIEQLYLVPLLAEQSLSGNLLD